MRSVNRELLLCVLFSPSPSLPACAAYVLVGATNATPDGRKYNQLEIQHEIFSSNIVLARSVREQPCQAVQDRDFSAPVDEKLSVYIRMFIRPLFFLAFLLAPKIPFCRDLQNVDSLAKILKW